MANPTVRGTELVDRVIDHVRSGRSAIRIREPRPLQPEVIEELRFADGAPLPPSLKRWLAFDAPWLVGTIGGLSSSALENLESAGFDLWLAGMAGLPGDEDEHGHPVDGEPGGHGPYRRALTLAANMGSASKVRLLLAAGASPRAEDRNGRTALLEAVSHGHHDVAELLLERGADPDHGQEGNAAPLHCAVEHGRSDTVRLLLDRGASLDARNWCGDTPLHIAFKRDLADIARLLIERGARRDLANHDGWTVDSLLDARGAARREVTVTYRASAEPQEVVIEVEMLTWDRTDFASELPQRLSAALAPLLAVAAAGGLGADRFDPGHALAEVMVAPQPTLVPMVARHLLRWQLRLAGVAPAGLALLLAPLILNPFGETRVLRLTVTGSSPLDNTADTVVIAGPDAQARIAALAGELRR